MSSPAKPLALRRTPFGKADGVEVDLYTLTNANGLTLKVTTYGAIVTSLSVPDRAGRLADVVLGFDDLAGYLKGHPYFGVTVGRVANRIRNATFELEGKTYRVAANDHAHHLHGGVKAWDKVVWTAETSETPEGPSVTLRHVSKDGEEGYPGTVSAAVTYTLTQANQLKLAMRATTDETTLVNMAHHSYFNLAGEGTGTIEAHELRLHAAAFTPGDPLVPTGVVEAVAGTPFDFTTAKAVGRDLKAAGGDPIGFDHNFVVDGAPMALRPVARLADPSSGRVLTLEADQPGVQLYSGNFLDGTVRGKAGHVYAQYTGLCLETQGFPNAINVPAWRAQVILRPGATYAHDMVFTFLTE
ncbi:MAG TPA: aldose epimerase family protein [Polyangia bacterium]|jgi:aldose 1-epimerase